MKHSQELPDIINDDLVFLKYKSYLLESPKFFSFVLDSDTNELLP